MIWFALQTVPQRELLAAREIPKRFGYTCFLPVEYKWRRVSGKRSRRKQVPIPMFRGYLFAHLPEDTNWNELIEVEVASKEIDLELPPAEIKKALATLDGVRILKGVVGFNNRPAPISDAAMEGLFRLQGQSIPHTRSVNTHRSVKAGDLALITAGGFEGHTVKIEGIEKGKARIFLSLFGAVREISVALENLEAA